MGKHVMSAQNTEVMGVKTQAKNREPQPKSVVPEVVMPEEGVMGRAMASKHVSAPPPHGVKSVAAEAGMKAAVAPAAAMKAPVAAGMATMLGLDWQSR